MYIRCIFGIDLVDIRQIFGIYSNIRHQIFNIWIWIFHFIGSNIFGIRIRSKPILCIYSYLYSDQTLIFVLHWSVVYSLYLWTGCFASQKLWWSVNKIFCNFEQYVSEKLYIKGIGTTITKSSMKTMKRFCHKKTLGDKWWSIGCVYLLLCL